MKTSRPRERKDLAKFLWCCSRGPQTGPRQYFCPTGGCSHTWVVFGVLDLLFVQSTSSHGAWGHFFFFFAIFQGFSDQVPLCILHYKEKFLLSLVKHSSLSSDFLTWFLNILSVISWVVALQKDTTHVLIPGTYECDLLWKNGLCRCN